MEAGAARVEPDEHGDGAVRLRPRLGEEALGDLALHHHAPGLDGAARGQRLGDERRGDVVREVGDELRRGRVEPADVDGHRVGEDDGDVRPVGERRAELVVERAIELDGVDVLHPVGEEGRQDAEARPDLEHDVGRRRARRAAR